jgi:hypothetical protein
MVSSIDVQICFCIRDFRARQKQLLYPLNLSQRFILILIVMSI